MIDPKEHEERKGDWFQTYTGRKAWVIDPRPEDIDIHDIAHALSLIARFGGHTIRHFSVAQHSVIVSHICRPEHALHGLLHDASEYAVGDCIRPMKKEMPVYRAIKDKWAVAIGRHFGLGEELWALPRDVKAADMACLMAERAELLADGPARLERAESYACDPDASEYGAAYAPVLSRDLEPWTHRQAEARFLQRFADLWTAERFIVGKRPPAGPKLIPVGTNESMQTRARALTAEGWDVSGY